MVHAVAAEDLPRNALTHRTHRTHYFFGQRFAATGVVRASVYGPPSSLGFFCPGCGELWARVLVEGSEADWAVRIIPCARHPVNLSVAGSLSQGLRQTELPLDEAARAADVLPRALANLEVLAFINHFERSEHASQ